jgi:hypothetical protein
VAQGVDPEFNPSITHTKKNPIKIDLPYDPTIPLLGIYLKEYTIV